MREIKFRVWSNETKSMSGNWYALNCLRSQEEGKQSLIRNVVMQFTALKDKNGVEIFEGDILDKKYKWVVKYSKDSFKCYSEIEASGENPLLNNLIFGRNLAKIPIEIIGNIHENPELLK